MGKSKKAYDIFDQDKPVTNVLLPQIDSRQPDDGLSSGHGKQATALAVPEVDFRTSITGGKSDGGTKVAQAQLAQALPSKSIRVNIPRFVSEPLTELHHESDSSAAPSRSTQSKHHILSNGRSGQPAVKVKPSAPRPPKSRVSQTRTSAAAVPAELKRTATKVSSSGHKITNTTGSTAISNDFTAREHNSGKKSRIVLTSQPQGSRGKKVKASVKGTSRARHERVKLNPTNERGGIQRAGKMKSPVTSPYHNRTFSAPSTPIKPPQVREQSGQVNSATKQWAKYASHTSAPSQQASPVTSVPRTVRLRGGRMPPRAITAHQHPRGSSQRQNGGPIARHNNDWTTWVELQVLLFGLTSEVHTGDLWTSFSQEGNIVCIDIVEDNSGHRNGMAKIKFRPPPNSAFWRRDSYCVSTRVKNCHVRMELDRMPRTFMAPSPVDPRIKYDEVMTMNAESVDFGIMHAPTTMMTMFTAVSSSQKSIQFRQNMLYREIVVELDLEIVDPRPPDTHPKAGKYNRTDIIRFTVPFRQLEDIHLIRSDKYKIVFLLSLNEPPRFSRKVDGLQTHEDGGRYWKENDAWYRQTDILYDPRSIRNSPLTLRKFKPIIDIGRWTTYRFTFDVRRNGQYIFNQMRQALKDHNVRICPFPDFKIINDREPAVWDYIDKASIIQTKSKTSLEELAEDYVPPLTFPVRFQLEVCISHGFFNEHNLTQDFVTRLMAMDPSKAQDVLEYVANQKKRIYDPMQIFSMTVVRGSTSSRKIPHYCAYVRSATVTPSTVYYHTPTVETSNRVIRQYAEHADRFLRVRFADEKFQGRIHSTEKDTMDEVLSRIKRVMAHGITIGDRHYEFLACGNSQFRENGAYFFAPLPHLQARHIRQWMGDFSDIREIAKYTARLGQCFSTTRAISCTKVTIVEIDDIERKSHGKNYTFTDGVGKISPFLAQLAAGELGLTTAEPPSVFQFRLGGCKGVLAVWPDAKAREIHLRFSQYKFPAKHEGLEIIRWSQMASAHLNRQLIHVLSSLGVPDKVFLAKLKKQLATLERAMVDEKKALTLLQKNIDANQMTLALAGMILDGFQRTREPFLMSLLYLWRAWSIKYLKEKARITIDDGAFLLGCVDETHTLKGHYDAVHLDDANTQQEKEEMLPEVFVQLSNGPDNKPYMVEGPVLLARNPSLHPGDMRVVRGVDVPALRHLKDVVVLPSTGDRDIPSMCSGGDLDGDDYIVMWDNDLLPLEWNHEPMDYSASDPLKVDRDVTINDITSFFVNFMKNDTLPTIANAHVAWADFLSDGVKDEKCLELAELHSKAVDYPKRGIPAIMTRDLKPHKRPHFMAKDYMSKDKIYTSTKILGQLFDQVEFVDFAPAFDMPFDQRILQAYPLDPKIIQDAANLKFKYDEALRRIMAQHEIKTEFEVWSTFVLEHALVIKDYKFHEEIGGLSQNLKDEFRAECYHMAGGKNFELIAPFVAAMYHVTNEEMQIAMNECRQMATVDGVDMPKRKMVPSSMTLISFPWLFPSVLGKLANGDYTPATEDATVPIQGESKRSVPKKKIFDNIDQDLLLETAEGVTHLGENLVLFEHPDEKNTEFEEPSDTPKDTAGLARNNSPADVDLVPNDDPAQEQPISSNASSSTLSDLGFGDSRAANPDSSQIDALFREEDKDVGTLSKTLTPSNSGSTSPKRNLQDSSAESLIKIENNEGNADDEWADNEDSDEDAGEGIVEVLIPSKGPSLIDRLRLLNET